MNYADDPTNSKYRYLRFKGSDTYRRYIQEEKDKAISDFQSHHKSLDVSTHGTYGGLLFDRRWKTKREEVLKRDSYACIICKNGNNLQVHHRQYHFVVRKNQFKPPWEYDNHLLITLCDACHKRGHNKFKVPTINV